MHIISAFARDDNILFRRFIVRCGRRSVFFCRILSFIVDIVSQSVYNTGEEKDTLSLRDILLSVQYICIIGSFVESLLVVRRLKNSLHVYLLLSCISLLINSTGYLLESIRCITRMLPIQQMVCFPVFHTAMGSSIICL